MTRQSLLVFAVVGLYFHVAVASSAASSVVIGGYHVPVLPGWQKDMHSDLPLARHIIVHGKTYIHTSADGRSIDFIKETDAYTLMFSFSVRTMSPTLTKSGLTEATLEGMKILKMNRAKAGTPLVTIHSQPGFFDGQPAEIINTTGVVQHSKDAYNNENVQFINGEQMYLITKVFIYKPLPTAMQAEAKRQWQAWRNGIRPVNP